MKPIIDVACGSRMFWFDRQNPAAVFMDNRETEQTLCDGRILTVKPDVKAEGARAPPVGAVAFLVASNPLLFPPPY